MKLASAKKVHYDSGPNMTPLVDVVMVILIFLMLTGSFAGLTHFLKGNMAEHGLEGGPVQENALGETKVDIRVDLNRTNPSQMVASIGNDRFGNSATLKQHLEGLRQRFADKPGDKIQVTIYPAKRVTYEMLIDVFSAATDANFPKIAFATSH